MEQVQVQEEKMDVKVKEGLQSILVRPRMRGAVAVRRCVVDTNNGSESSACGGLRTLFGYGRQTASLVHAIAFRQY